MGVPISRKAILGGKCVDTGENLGPPLTELVDTFVGIAGANYGAALCFLQFGETCGMIKLSKLTFIISFIKINGQVTATTHKLFWNMFTIHQKTCVISRISDFFLSSCVTSFFLVHILF
jgi:hypothetical protein